MASVAKFRLDNKVAIIYGGSYGIGKGISIIFSEAGAAVVIVSRNKEKGNEALTQLPGSKKLYIQADVKKYGDHERIVKEVMDNFKQIDVIVCCAGIYPEMEIMSSGYTLEFIDDLIDVNVKGSIYAVKSTLNFLKKSGNGRIIFISSITGGHTGMPGHTIYGATKAAQIGYARSAAVELAKWKITVNCVLPGNIWTESLEGLGGDYVALTKKAIPLKRLGTTEEIGNTVLFLASSEAAFITGQEITVDGGQIRPEYVAD